MLVRELAIAINELRVTSPAIDTYAPHVQWSIERIDLEKYFVRTIFIYREPVFDLSGIPSKLYAIRNVMAGHVVDKTKIVLMLKKLVRKRFPAMVPDPVGQGITIFDTACGPYGRVGFFFLRMSLKIKRNAFEAIRYPVIESTKLKFKLLFFSPLGTGDRF